MQSRLDFWLISIQLEYLINNIWALSGNISDHSKVTIELELMGSCKLGRGLWKFKNDFLFEPKLYAAR